MTNMDHRWCYANPTKAAAEIEKLREAIKPFAELADSYSDTFADNTQISTRESDDGDSTYAFTLGDLRRADQALQPEN